MALLKVVLGRLTTVPHYVTITRFQSGKEALKFELLIRWKRTTNHKLLHATAIVILTAS